MKAVTYGEIPAYPAFRELFQAACVHGRYVITNHEHAGEYRDNQLYALIVQLKAAWENGDERAGEFASNIMETLGIEWV